VSDIKIGLGLGDKVDGVVVWASVTEIPACAFTKLETSTAMTMIGVFFMDDFK
jgi:hypothetical protein